jgi:hypothetical protein
MVVMLFSRVSEGRRNRDALLPVQKNLNKPDETDVQRGMIKKRMALHT